MAYQALIYEKKGNIAYVTLNRPERLNATNHAMRDDLYHIWQDVMKDLVPSPKSESLNGRADRDKWIYRGRSNLEVA